MWVHMDALHHDTESEAITETVTHALTVQQQELSCFGYDYFMETLHNTSTLLLHNTGCLKCTLTPVGNGFRAQATWAALELDSIESVWADLEAMARARVALYEEIVAAHRDLDINAIHSCVSLPAAITAGMS